MNCRNERCCVECGLVYGEAIPDREYQPDIKQIVKEYKKYYNQYIYFGGRHFPLNAFKIAAKYFSIIKTSHRTIHRKSILAFLLRQACMETEQFIPSDKELCDLMQVTDLRWGHKFIIDLIFKGDMQFNKVDVCRCEIASLFARLYKHSEIELQNRVYNLVKSIECNVTTITKVVAATYIMLNKSVSIDKLCRIRDINRTTEAIESFIKRYSL
jgi:hypothetical protein